MTRIFILTELKQKINQLSTEEIFDFFINQTGCITLDDELDFFTGIRNNQFVQYTVYEDDNTESDYLERRINVPFIVNSNDKTIKSFQLQENSSYEWDMTMWDSEMKEEMIGILLRENISDLLILKYNPKFPIDKHIDSLEYVMILALGLAFLLNVPKLSTADSLLFDCQGYKLDRSLLSSLQNKYGFYQRFGFKIRPIVKNALTFIKHAPVKELAKLQRVKLNDDIELDDITVEEYVNKYDKDCEKLRTLLQLIQSFPLQYYKTSKKNNISNERIFSALDVLSEHFLDQTKTITDEDFDYLVNLYEN